MHYESTRYGTRKGHIMGRTLTDDLKALATVTPDDKARSKTSRLRAYLAEIELALGTGATHANVLDTLKLHGLEMTPAVFSTTLRRLRREKKCRSKQAEIIPGPPATATNKATPPATLLHDPTEPIDMEKLIKHGKGKPS